MLPYKRVILHPDTFFVISCFPQAFYFNWIWWLTWQSTWEWKVRLGALSIFSTTIMIRHESSESSFGGRPCTDQETTPFKAQTSIALWWVWQNDFWNNLRGRALWIRVDADETGTRVRGAARHGAAWRLSIQPTLLPCLASITIKSWPLRALIVRRHVSHPISLSPANTGRP